MSDGPKTLLQAVRHFTDLNVCHEYLIGVKWPDCRIVCPKCGGDVIGRINSRRMLQCKAKECRKQFSSKVGTIFEDSPLGLDKWFVGVWSIANAKNGISSHEVGRALGITQKSAWFMLHRIRMAMKSGTFGKMDGEVESDETFVGGKAANMHAKRRNKVITGRGAVGKAIVHGLLERGHDGEPSQVRASVVLDTEAATLVPEIVANVELGTSVYTDAARQLARYVDEQVFRFNERIKNDAERFREVMLAVVGKRLTYRQLAGVGGCGFMGLE